VKKFSFRLRRLLDIRAQQKRVRAAALARLRKQLADLDDKISKANQEWARLRRQLLRQQAAASHERIELTMYMEALDLRLAGMHDFRKKLQQDIERARQSFENAAQGEKALEKLRARRFEEFVHALGRAEQQIADELAMQKDWRESA
jgi:flagellar export protein FliJ